MSAAVRYRVYPPRGRLRARSFGTIDRAKAFAERAYAERGDGVGDAAPVRVTYGRLDIGSWTATGWVDGTYRIEGVLP